MTIDTIGTLPGARLDRSGPVEASPPPAGRAPAAPTATAAAVKPKEATASVDELKDAVKELNGSPHAQGLEFSIDEDSKRTIVKVIDVATKEVLRQMPSEEALRIARSLDKTAGLLIRQQA